MAGRRLKNISFYRKAVKLKIERAFFKISEAYSCISKGFIGKIQRLFRKQTGVSAILVAAFMPLLVLSVNYLIKYIQKSKVEVTVFEVPYVIGKSVAGAFNPGKTWSEQKDSLYSIAAQIYNDVIHTSGKAMEFEAEKVVKAKGEGAESNVDSLFDFYRRFCTLGRKGTDLDIENELMFIGRPPFANFSHNESKESVSYTKYSVDSEGSAYSVSKYKENLNKLSISLDNETIKVKCPKLGKIANVTLPRNDVDIIIAIPTNDVSSNTSNPQIKQIAKACQEFLRQFLHTVGVAVGIVPYSGKVSLSPQMAERGLTTSIPMSDNPGTLTYIVQAMFYGSDGQAGGDITGSNYGSVRQNWGYRNKKWYECPIMARRGIQSEYRGMTMNSGANSDNTTLLLDMTTDPAADTTDHYKFMQMNRNPCYLGFCNTLAMACEKNCPTYKSNPYFMTELTSDIPGLIYDMELFLPFNDTKNKSNFLFLPIVMAGNLLSWGSHPSEELTEDETERVLEKSRDNKKRVVIIIANAPDHFEPMELTYLGFNNDYSEIPMIESDTIVFYKSGGYAETTDDNGNKAYKGVKGAIQFTAEGGNLASDGYIFKLDKNNPDKETKARISFLNKGMLKIVTKRPNPAQITVYSDNGVTDNVKTHSLETGKKTLKFEGPQQVKNWTDLDKKFIPGNFSTKGPNFGHNLSTKKVKVKLSNCKLTKATIKNQILRFYAAYDESKEGKTLIENNNSVWYNTPTDMKKIMDPCIDVSENYENDISGVGWLFDGVCIRAYGFNPKCYGISKLGKFVMALAGISDSAVIPGTMSIKKNKKVFGRDVPYFGDDESVYYDELSGIKYRVYSSSSDSAFSQAVQIGTGKSKIESYHYYKVFSSKMKRMRSVNQYITNYGYYPPISPSDEENNNCCDKGWGLETYTCSHSEDYGGKSCTYQEKDYGTTYTCGDKWYKYEIERYVLNEEDECNPKKEVISGWLPCHVRSSIYGCALGYGRLNKCPKSRGILGLGGTTYKEFENFCVWDKPGYKEGLKCYWVQQNEGRGTVGNAEPIETTTTCYKKTATVDHNNSLSCEGVCWEYYPKVNHMWFVESTEKSVTCTGSDGYTPQSKQELKYSTIQEQKTENCVFNDGSRDSSNNVINSYCEWGNDSPPSVYGYREAHIYHSSPGCSEERVSGVKSKDIRTGKWAETTTEQKRFYSFYKRNPDGSTNSPTFEICDLSGHSNCSATDYSGSPKGTIDESLTEKSPYRYPLYNFFFVSGDDLKSTSYEYNSDGELTSFINSESNSDLLTNRGIYLLPVNGEENTYWVCFCGDADLQLDFEDVSVSSVQFSNIEAAKVTTVDGGRAYDPETQQWVTGGESTISRENYALNLNGEKTETVGVDVNQIEDKKIFYIHPDQIVGETDDNGNYYVDLKIKGDVCIQSIELTNRPLKEIDSVRYYDHPNIINDNLINTRIIDGYDQGKNRQMKLYGSIHYDEYATGSLPSVGSIQKLFYNKKNGTAAKYVYPNIEEQRSALAGEEGDFFIQLWDYNDEVPEIRWKVGDKIQNSDANTEFGSFKSGYYFSGLHRMFFPYTTYNKDWAGYSYAKHSAQVFMGYTLPINYILASNGYQETFRVDTNSTYTKSDKALKTLATDACRTLKNDLSNNKGEPTVYLVNYNSAGTNNMSHMSDCADYILTATNENDLITVLKGIASDIEETSKSSELKVEVEDYSE